MGSFVTARRFERVARIEPIDRSASASAAVDVSSLDSLDECRDVLRVLDRSHRAEYERLLRSHEGLKDGE